MREEILHRRISIIPNLFNSGNQRVDIFILVGTVGLGLLELLFVVLFKCILDCSLIFCNAVLTVSF